MIPPSIRFVPSAATTRDVLSIEEKSFAGFTAKFLLLRVEPWLDVAAELIRVQPRFRLNSRETAKFEFSRLIEIFKNKVIIKIGNLRYFIK